MPIYEYECTECGNRTEVWQKFSDSPITQCELCRGKMKKMISQSTFHLKGSGWYMTDYASGHRGSGLRKEKPDENAAAKKEEKVTEDKPKKVASPANTQEDKD